MKRGKDGEKVSEPMFPRLSVNDAEKGGPRAPPRNKMALYEQLCTPSHRFNTGMFNSCPNVKPSCLTTPVSSSLGGGYERSRFPPIHVPPSIQPSQAERPVSPPTRGMNLNFTPLEDLEQRQTGGEEEDYMVPIYFQSDAAQARASNRSNTEAVKSSLGTYAGHPAKNKSSSHANSEQNHSSLPTQEDGRNHSQRQPKERFSTGSDSNKYASSVRSREMIDRHAKLACGSTPRGFRDPASKDIDRQQNTEAGIQQHNFKARLHMEEGAHNVSRTMECRRDKVNEDPLRTKSIPHSGDSRSISHQAGRDNGYRGHQVHDLPSLENADNSDGVSETSMVDSMSGLDITPDDVVGIIGYKHFLKARKAIVNQQRVFSVQVFELHRLIQVQRLIAGSPQIMVDDNAYIGKAVKGPPANKNPSLENVMKPPLYSLKPKSHPEKPNRDAECTAENTVKSNGRSAAQMPNYGPYSGNMPPTPSSTDPRSAPWCFPQPSGHQWLVPVMSPSEGLIYKPYPGPGIMSPASGGYGPMGGTPDPSSQFLNGNFMNPSYGFPGPYFPPYAQHPQGSGIPPGQNYFSPFSMPGINPTISTSAVEQMNQFTGSGMHRQPVQSASRASNPNQSSCNLQKQPSDVAPQSRKARQPKEKGLHGSTASSPLQRPQGREVRRGEEKTPVPTPSAETRDPLSLFPTNPAGPARTPSPPLPAPSHTISNQPRVIKVVPHNPRSATASAARIFQSIQRERNHCDDSEN